MLRQQSGGNYDANRNSGEGDRFNYNVLGTNSGSGTRSGSKCITFDETMDDLIASSSMVFVTGPAKAALSSIKRFTEKCGGLSAGRMDGRINGSVQNIPEHYLLIDRIEGEGEGEDKDQGRYRGVTVPDQLLSFHAENGKVLIDLMENVPRDALIIYSYREETERLLSAIHHVLEINCRSKNNITPIMNNDTHCVYDETYVVKDVVEPKIYEIGRGAPEIMTCEFYDAIERNFPNMVFMNFKQMDNLQRAITKHQCPEYDEAPFHLNAAVDRKEKNQNSILLKLEKDGGMVTVEKWLQEKRAMLEWRLNLKGRGGQQCQGKTRKMEDELYECHDELLQVTRDTSF